MSDAALQLASARRIEGVYEDEIDARVDLLLANYQRVTANPRSMGYLRFLLKHYAKSPTPWRDCVADNTKRFGPDKVKGLCGVVKDLVRQRTDWRGKGPRPGDTPADSPGVGIAYGDAPAANPPWHGGHGLSEGGCPGRLLGPMPDEVSVVLSDLASRCDVFRVLVGLDAPPTFDGVTT